MSVCTTFVIWTMGEQSRSVGDRVKCSTRARRTATSAHSCSRSAHRSAHLRRTCASSSRSSRCARCSRCSSQELCWDRDRAWACCARSRRHSSLLVLNAAPSAPICDSTRRLSSAHDIHFTLFMLFSFHTQQMPYSEGDKGRWSGNLRRTIAPSNIHRSTNHNAMNSSSRKNKARNREIDRKQLFLILQFKIIMEKIRLKRRF